MRGEHTIQMIDATCQQGSSPHARGAPDCRDACEQRAGIIPACAGSTRSRSGGLTTLTGSSPHARGALVRRHHLAHLAGIIPACAGSTCRSRRRGPSRRDHPRMRGEHYTKPHGMKPEVGSSPHARGARRVTRVRVIAVGIIPACAGSTLTISRSSHWHRDHPRMRGEHRVARHGQTTALGIIPACAGSTASRPSLIESRRDHPRMRGEHRSASEKSVPAMGSSPHARGAHLNTCGFAQDSSESH